MDISEFLEACERSPAKTVVEIIEKINLTVSHLRPN